MFVDSSGWILGTNRTSSLDKFSKNPLPFATRPDGSRAHDNMCSTTYVRRPFLALREH